MNIIKKYWYIIILILIILIFIFFNLFPISNANNKLKTYLIKNQFKTTSENEVQLESNLNLSDYNEKKDATYEVIGFNFQNSKFNLINKTKVNNLENIYTISLNLLTGEYIGYYNINNNYDQLYIKATLNLKNMEFECNTQGYKGLNEYCEKLEYKMRDFSNLVNDYLTDSNSDSYYFKKLYN